MAEYVTAGDLAKVLAKVSPSSPVVVNMSDGPIWITKVRETDRAFYLEGKKGKTMTEDKTCNDCQHYDPLDGICNKWDEYRHGYDDACGEFVQETDTLIDKDQMSLF